MFSLFSRKEVFDKQHHFPSITLFLHPSICDVLEVPFPPQEEKKEEENHEKQQQPPPTKAVSHKSGCAGGRGEGESNPESSCSVLRLASCGQPGGLLQTKSWEGETCTTLPRVAPCRYSQAPAGQFHGPPSYPMCKLCLRLQGETLLFWTPGWAGGLGVGGLLFFLFPLQAQAACLVALAAAGSRAAHRQAAARLPKNSSSRAG